MWRSLVARCNGVAKVAGSNPVTPTKEIPTKTAAYGSCRAAVFVCVEKLSKYFRKTLALQQSLHRIRVPFRLLPPRIVAIEVVLGHAFIGVAHEHLYVVHRRAFQL